MSRAPAALGLRRTGDSPDRRRSRFRLPRCRRRAHRRRGDAAADPRAGDPARLEAGLDLSRPRPPAGDRDRRGRTQAVPVPRALAEAAGRAQVQGDARLRFLAAAATQWRDRRSAPTGDATRAGFGLLGAPAGPRFLPHWRRGLRGGKQQLRPGDGAPRSGHAESRRGDLRLPCQERPPSRPVDPRPRRPACDRGHAPSPLGAGGSVRLARRRRMERRALRRSQRLHPGKDRRPLLRQGLPYLARHRPRRGRAGGKARAHF